MSPLPPVDKIRIAGEMHRAGKTIAEIAQHFGVVERTVRAWRKNTAWGHEIGEEEHIRLRSLVALEFYYSNQYSNDVKELRAEIVRSATQERETMDNLWAIANAALTEAKEFVDGGESPLEACKKVGGSSVTYLLQVYSQLRRSQEESMARLQGIDQLLALLKEQKTLREQATP
ncbi:MAG: helix-turn-helix domain-containing protein [Cyanophyceae cyanobacterium]